MAFDAVLNIENGIAKVTLTGELDASVASVFQEKIHQAASANAQKLVLLVQDLTYMSSAGLRTLVFAKQKMGAQVKIYLIGTQEQVVEPIRQTGFHYSVIMLDSYDPAIIEG
jgi:anti-anti-sigma factor